MQIKYGSTRIASLSPLLGIAIKFPRIYLHEIQEHSKACKSIKGLRWFLSVLPKDLAVICADFTKGLQANVLEFWFYVRTQNGFALPTYFSFFGLFNIQKLGVPPPPTECWDIAGPIINIGGKDIFDAHCFTSVSNFAVERDGKLLLLDYASPQSQFVLRKYEKELCEHFSNYAEKMAEREKQRVGQEFF